MVGPGEYVLDSPYADRYFRELSPAWINYVAALNGIASRPLDAPFAYLELGSGLGTSIAVHAGAFPAATFHGVDLNATHIEVARDHAATLGAANVVFHESSFDDVPALALPMFDFIVLHGVYSWVGAPARAALRRIVRESLKPGGLVYVSYNCLPGWAAEAPLRKLLIELTRTESGDSAQRATAAVQTLQQLSSGQLRFFVAHPAVASAIDAYARSGGNYLAHEFLNDAWEPFYSIDVADDMADAGVRYVGSATLADNHPVLMLDGPAVRAVARLTTARQQQLAIDFAVNQRFRRDVFVSRAAPQQDHALHLDAQPIGCLNEPELLPVKARVPRGEISFQEPFIRDVRALLAGGSTTFGEAVTSLGAGGSDRDEIRRNLTFLLAAGTLVPCARAWQVELGAGRLTPIAERALGRALARGEPQHVPSPVLGGGVLVQPDEARALTEWVSSGAAAPASARLFARLGLLS
jgi:SAM-dependent methyltransferase